MPPGYEQYDPQGNAYCLEVVKPIYGIPQAGRRFQRSIFPWLRSQGLCQLDDSDSGIWVYRPGGCPAKVSPEPNASTTNTANSAPDPAKVEAALAAYVQATKPEERLVCGVYVDNLQIVHSGKITDPSSKVKSFLDAIQRDWDVEDEGEMVDLLGIEIKHGKDKSITLHQTKYIKKLVAEFLPNGVPPGIPKNCLPYSTQLIEIVHDAEHMRTTSPSGKCTFPELLEPYQRRLGCLMYLANSTRPDIAYAVGMHCRNMSSPTPALLRELDYILVYLSRNASVGLTYENNPSALYGYCDASLEASKSTSGYLIKWQGSTVSWGSTKQKSTAVSSCEAEIYALSEGAKDVIYFRKLLSGLNEDMSEPSPCATDNKGAADLAYNPEHHRRSKHIERRHFYIRDMVEALELSVPLVRTDVNEADFLTKPLKSHHTFYSLRARIMNEPPESRAAS